jgi:hypothetical protein
MTLISRPAGAESSRQMAERQSSTMASHRASGLIPQ